MTTIARPRTVNQLLQDRAIMHAHRLEQFKNHQVREVVGEMNRGFAELNEHIAGRLASIRARGNDLDTRATPRLRTLSDEIGKQLDETMEKARKRLESDLTEYAKVEAAWQQGVIQTTVPKVLRLTVNGPNADALAKIVRERPFEGGTMGEWFGGLAGKTKQGIEREITHGLSEGETIDQMIARIRGTRENRFEDGVFQVSRRNAESIVRTSTAHVTSSAREETFSANPDVVEAVQAVATLDTRTTLFCMKIDGQVFPVNKGRRSPFHWGCRTIMVPVLTSWRKLGFSVSEIPASTRASMNGQVPDKVTYRQWIKEQPAKAQDEALGPERAALLRSGKVEVDEFTEDRGRTLSLDEIRERVNLN